MGLYNLLGLGIFSRMQQNLGRLRRPTRTDAAFCVSKGATAPHLQLLLLLRALLV